MLSARENGNPDDPQLLALRALGWVLQDDRRAQRLLDLTGLSPEVLRMALRNPDMLAAVLDFLAGYEPDLVACAADIGVPPAALVDAAIALRS